jgi:hypothetical protein
LPIYTAERYQIMSQQYSLSDEFIAQLAKLLQLALLTGTNLADNLRLVRVTQADDGTVVLTEEYKKNFEANIEKMLAEVETIKEDMRNTVASA